MKDAKIDRRYLRDTLAALLNIPSPTGMTDQAAGFVCAELEALGIPFELTRRGAIRADFEGVKTSPDRAIVSHIDTLGAMVKGYRANGRLEVAPIGTWSPRFAEGARCTVFSDDGARYRGTLLPLKASGHTFGDEIDKQPSRWRTMEVRLDERTDSEKSTRALGIHVGDTIAVDSGADFTDNGFINARHLDDKAGVAAVLTAAKSLRDAKVTLPLACHLVFTISEEVGVGASHILHGDVAELVSVDNGTIAEGQYTSEFGVTVAMQDSTGPFDWHLSRNLIHLCKRYRIEHARDVFRFYRSDAASALEAGNDIRTALVCFGLDSSHGWERTHIDSLAALARLLTLYAQSAALFERDREALGPIGDLPPSEEQEGLDEAAE